MPPKIDLEPYKDEILSWVSEKHTIPEILSKIIGILRVECSLNTLKRTLQEWGVSRNRKNRSPEVERIKLRISELFAGNYNNDMILQALSVEGMPLHRRQLARYRLDLGLIRRMTIEEREQKYQQLVGIIREELDHGGIEGYGAGLIKTHFRQIGVTAPCKLIYNIVKGLDSKGYKRYMNDIQRKKQEMVVKGPDWGWSLNQYNKLAL
jgi:hypothetical protein